MEEVPVVTAFVSSVFTESIVFSLKCGETCWSKEKGGGSIGGNHVSLAGFMMFVKHFNPRYF